MKATLMLTLFAVAIAVLFAVQFRYERFMDRGLIFEVDRFTSQACHIPLTIVSDKVAGQTLSIPRCRAK